MIFQKIIADCMAGFDQRARRALDQARADGLNEASIKHLEAKIAELRAVAVEKTFVAFLKCTARKPKRGERSVS